MGVTLGATTYGVSSLLLMAGYFSRPGFVEFSDPRDADDAIRNLHGYDFDGHRLAVELARGARTGGTV